MDAPGPVGWFGRDWAWLVFPQDVHERIEYPPSWIHMHLPAAPTAQSHPPTARGERLKEATVEAKRVIDQYRQEKEKQFEDFVKSVRGLASCLWLLIVGSLNVPACRIVSYIHHSCAD